MSITLYILYVYTANSPARSRRMVLATFFYFQCCLLIFLLTHQTHNLARGLEVDAPVQRVFKFKVFTDVGMSILLAQLKMSTRPKFAHFQGGFCTSIRIHTHIWQHISLLKFGHYPKGHHANDVRCNECSHLFWHITYGSVGNGVSNNWSH